MLNGKFYTGLTAKQINRCGNGQNRLESHFFWPDDTKAESVVETRLKRRASLQYEQMERPRLQRLNSIEESNANTKGLFNREFEKSSIQFYDNIEEQPESGPHQDSRIQAILKAKSARREIAAKPTATRFELPEKVIDEEYTTAKKQQTYNSKIKFYDFPDEELNNSNKSNSKKRPDMNDKRELERNSKNSPKLQIKRNVSNFSDVDDVPEVKVKNNIARTDIKDNRRTHADQVRNNVSQEEDDTRLYRGHEDFPDTKKRIAYRNEERSPISMKTRQNNNFSKHQNNNQKWSRKSELNEPFYVDEDQPDINCIENNMRNVRIHSRPTKHVTYRDNYEDQMKDVFCYDGYNGKTAFNRSGIHGTSASSSKQRPGSNLRQQQFRPKSPEFYDGNTNTEEELQYMETGRRTTTKTNYNNNVSRSNNSSKSDNNSNNYIDNSDKININQKAQRQISPKMSTTTTAAARATSITTATALESSEPTTDIHKHLRSNIFLNDSDLTSTTPTPKFRRSARNSAVGRVSVGLPD